jgi:hypothetical protein
VAFEPCAHANPGTIRNAIHNHTLNDKLRLLIWKPPLIDPTFPDAQRQEAQVGPRAFVIHPPMQVPQKYKSGALNSTRVQAMSRKSL